MKMLDLAKFEKVKEDKNTTTMRHKDGHEMTILIAKLPKIHREQLKRLKMADGGKVAKYDEGTPDATVSKDDAKEAPEDQPMAGTQPLGQNPAAQLAQNPVNVQTPNIPSAQSNLNPNGTMNPAAVAQNAQAANTGQAKISAAQSAAMVPLQQQYIKDQAVAAQIDQQNLNDLKGHSDALNQYIQNNPIDPQSYVQNMGSGQKVATALGLIIGGFQGGRNGTGNNPALNFLNSQIDRDIQGQKDRMDQQKTIYGAYHQLYGDSQAANSATKASMLDIYNHQAQQLAQKLGTPQAQVAAQALGTNLALEKSKSLQDAVVDLRNLPGYGAKQIQPGQTPSQVENAEHGQGTQSQPAQSDRILNGNAQNIYNNLKYDHTHTPQQISDAQQQFEQSYQADKALSQIDAIYPLAAQNTTMAGSVANGIEDTVGQVPFGIGKVLGELPGEAIRDLGGQKEKQGQAYRTQLEGYIDSALAGTGATPTDKADMARKYFPNESDSPETKAVKLKGLKDKIINLQHTGIIDRMGMTNKR